MTQYFIVEDTVRIALVYKDVLKLFGLSVEKFGVISDTEGLYRRDRRGMLNLWNIFVEYLEGNNI